MSVVMSEDKDASEVKFFCFDRIIDNEAWLWAYRDRRTSLMILTNLPIYLEFISYLYPIESHPIPWYHSETSIDLIRTVEKIEEDCVVRRGFEGIIIRSPDSSYKSGRATLKEASLFKYKRTDDAEAVILETLELEHNSNERTFDERGYSKRSSHKAGKSGTSLAGSLLCKGINGKYKDKEMDR